MKMHGDPLCPPPEFAGFKSATALLRDAIRRSPFGRAFSNQVGEAGGLVEAQASVNSPVRSRLYRSKFLRADLHFGAFFKI